MKLSVFLAVLLPSVSAFVVPCIPPSIRVASNTVGKSTGALCSSNRELVWDVSQLWQDIVGGKSPTVASADPKVRVDGSIKLHVFVRARALGC